MFLILTIVLVISLVGSLPFWPHSKTWGYYPSAGAAIVILVILVLLILGRL
jgi:hypothetical protein